MTTDHVLVADDSLGVAQGLVALLRTKAVGGKASDLAGLSSALPSGVDLLVLDADGAVEQTATMIEAVREQSPLVGVLLLMSGDEEQSARRAAKLRASGWLSRNCRGEDFVATVLALLRQEVVGGHRVGPSRPKSVAELMFSQLTDREHDVLRLLAKGGTTASIGQSLSISEHTVRTHIRNLLYRLDVHSRVEAVAFAQQSGVLSKGNGEVDVEPNS